MGNIPKENGTVVRDLSRQMDEDIAQTKMLLLKSLGQIMAPMDTSDPVTHLQCEKMAMLSIKEALGVLECIHVNNRNVVEICDHNAYLARYRQRHGGDT